MLKTNTSEILRKAYAFEELCGDIFTSKGFLVQQDVKFNNYNDVADMILTRKDGKKVAIEIKFYRTRKPNKSMLLKAIKVAKDAAQELNIENAVIIIGMPLENSFKEELKEDFDIHIIDSKNLMYLTKDNDILRTKLINLLYDIPQDIPVEENIELFDINSLFYEANSHSYPEILYNLPRGELLGKELENIRTGNSTFSLYEDKCEEILKYLFDENLTGWHRQSRTDDGLNRYDLICRVRRGNEFWEFLINDFHSRYIVFEFKNYSTKVKQTQVYTTEKYLFQTALRNVCFIISRTGLDNNAINATKGVLRESGKLIISLCDDDLFKLLQLKESGDEPSDYLFELIDDTLLKLSK
ncbi:restriction endonuclease [Metabacillus bambusae]|uniref:Restriction endonuclease n=1 Tax=Metabacillus bambusae TaxID=2795218 RepID=A0ABS3N727_9BACI|nr:restriction endonuclease [Metabacillus bambusae]MBO1514080.1 restriction endonuclease [Metabacillus bambusae]